MQACRLGPARMIIRGFSKTPRRKGDLSWARFRLSTGKTGARAFSSSSGRFNSTMAAYDINDDETTNSGPDTMEFLYQGHLEAVQARATRLHDEPWMINLGRDGDNEWLTGTRPQNWFTGVAPRECPGKK